MKALLSLFFLFFAAHTAKADVSVPRAKQYLWTQYDVAALGGASVAHALGVDLPAGAIITDVWMYINTQFAAAGTESLALQCAGTNDLMALTPVSSLLPDRMLASRLLGNTFNGGSALIPASPTALNFSQGFGSVPSDCSVQAIVGSAAGDNPYTAGKATFIVEYFRK